jgi:membrane protease YdiL (CAAX protease family)
MGHRAPPVTAAALRPSRAWPERASGALIMAVVGPLLAALPIALALPPAAALPLVLATLAAFLGCALHAGDPVARRRRHAVLRLRSPARDLPLVVLAAGAALVALGALAAVYARYLPAPATRSRAWDGYLAGGAAHRTAVAVVLVAVVPTMVELALRGTLLTRLAHRLGAARAIGASAALFAALYLGLWVTPLVFALGLALGALAWASRSVWGAVLLHAGWNALAVFGDVRALDAARAGTLALAAGAAVATAVFVGAVATLHARRPRAGLAVGAARG